MTGGPLVALVLAGDKAIEVVRGLTGATDGRAAAPGTIRGDLSLSNRENLVHASDFRRQRQARDRPLVPGVAGVRAPGRLGYSCRTGVDPAITGEPPEERATRPQ
jgi:hypothetical protein